MTSSAYRYQGAREEQRIHERPHSERQRLNLGAILGSMPRSDVPAERTRSGGARFSNGTVQDAALGIEIVGHPHAQYSDGGGDSCESRRQNFQKNASKGMEQGGIPWRAELSTELHDDSRRKDSRRSRNIPARSILKTGDASKRNRDRHSLDDANPAGDSRLRSAQNSDPMQERTSGRRPCISFGAPQVYAIEDVSDMVLQMASEADAEHERLRLERKRGKRKGASTSSHDSSHDAPPSTTKFAVFTLETSCEQPSDDFLSLNHHRPQTARFSMDSNVAATEGIPQRSRLEDEFSPGRVQGVKMSHITGSRASTTSVTPRETFQGDGVCEDELQHPLSLVDRMACPLMFNEVKESSCRKTASCRGGARALNSAGGMSLREKKKKTKDSTESYDMESASHSRKPSGQGVPGDFSSSRESVSRGRSGMRRHPSKRDQTPFNRGIPESTYSDDECSEDNTVQFHSNMDRSDHRETGTCSRGGIAPQFSEETVELRGEQERGRRGQRAKLPSKRDQTPFNSCRTRFEGSDDEGSTDEDRYEISNRADDSSTFGRQISKKEKSLSFDLTEERMPSPFYYDEKMMPSSQKTVPSKRDQTRFSSNIEQFWNSDSEAYQFQSGNRRPIAQDSNSAPSRLKKKLSWESTPEKEIASSQRVECGRLSNSGLKQEESSGLVDPKMSTRSSENDEYGRSESRGRNEVKRRPSKRDQTPFNRGVLGLSLSDDDDSNEQQCTTNYSPSKSLRGALQMKPTTKFATEDACIGADDDGHNSPSSSQRGRNEMRRKPSKRDQTPFNRGMFGATYSDDESDGDGPTSSQAVASRHRKSKRTSVPGVTLTDAQSEENENQEELSRGRGEMRRKPSKRDQTPFNRGMLGRTFSDDEDSEDDRSLHSKALPNVSSGPDTNSGEGNSQDTSAGSSSTSPRGRGGGEHRKPSKRDQTPFNRGTLGKTFSDGESDDSESTSLDASRFKEPKRRVRNQVTIERSETGGMHPHAQVPPKDTSDRTRGRNEVRRRPSKRDQTPFNREILGADLHGDDDSDDAEISHGPFTKAGVARQSEVDEPSEVNEANKTGNRRRPTFVEHDSQMISSANDRVRRRPMFADAGSETRNDIQAVAGKPRFMEQTNEETDLDETALKNASRGRGEGRRMPSKRDQTPFNRSMLGCTVSDEDSDEEFPGRGRGIGESFLKGERAQVSNKHSDSTKTEKRNKEIKEKEMCADGYDDSKSARTKSEKEYSLRRPMFMDVPKERMDSDEASTMTTRGRGEGRRKPTKRDQTPFNRSMLGSTFSDEEHSSEDEPSGSLPNGGDASSPVKKPCTSSDASVSSMREPAKDEEMEYGDMNTEDDCQGEKESSLVKVKATSSNECDLRPGRPHGGLATHQQCQPNSCELADEAEEQEVTNRGREQKPPGLKKVLSNSKRASTREQTPFYISRPLSNGSDVDEEYSDLCKEKLRGRGSNLADIAEDENCSGAKHEKQSVEPEPEQDCNEGHDLSSQSEHGNILATDFVAVSDGAEVPRTYSANKAMLDKNPDAKSEPLPQLKTEALREYEQASSNCVDAALTCESTEPPTVTSQAATELSVTSKSTGASILSQDCFLPEGAGEVKFFGLGDMDLEEVAEEGFEVIPNNLSNLLAKSGDEKVSTKPFEIDSEFIGAGESRTMCATSLEAVPDFTNTADDIGSVSVEKSETGNSSDPKNLDRANNHVGIGQEFNFSGSCDKETQVEKCEDLPGSKVLGDQTIDEGGGESNSLGDLREFVEAESGPRMKSSGPLSEDKAVVSLGVATLSSGFSIAGALSNSDSFGSTCKKNDSGTMN